MRPEKITLKNIGPFRGVHTVDFTELGDIFLVYGKTGAGKTTIFDAMSYALYGEVPGARRGLAKQMRSQFSADGDESAVSLEFALSGKRYRVTRTLAGERLGVRSGKMQSYAEEATLEEWAAGSWRGVALANKSETDAAILALIGLSDEEFSRIVLLPQGEFARFLRQNSSERKEVLAKLFPVERYGQVIELARNRAREAELQQRETEQNILALGRRFNALAYDGDRAALAAEIHATRERQTTLRKELAERSAQLEKSRAAAEKRNRLAALESRIAELETRRASIDAKKKELDDAVRAEPLRVSLSHIDSQRAQMAAIAAEIVAVTDDIDSAEKALAELERDAGRIARLRAEREGLLVQKERLVIAADIASDIGAESDAYAETETRLAAAKKRNAALKAESTARGARLAEISRDAGLLEERDADNDRMRKELDALKQLRALSEDHERAAKNMQAHAAAAERARELVAENERDGEIARAGLSDLESTSHAAEESERAAILARTLRDGEPCPVCGSLTHPSPAMPAALDSFTLAERIGAEKRRIEQIEARKAELRKELATREANAAAADEQCAQYAKRYRAIAEERGIEQSTDGIPSAAEAAASLQDAVRRMQETSDALAKSRSAWRETEDLRKKEAETSEASIRLSDEIAALMTEGAARKANLDGMKARYAEAFPDSGDRVPDPDDAEEALEKCAATLLTIDAETSKHDEGQKNARFRIAALGAQKSERESRERELAAEIGKLEAAFSSECATAGFPDRDGLRAASRTEGERESLAREIGEYAAARADAEARASQLAGELGSGTTENVDDAEREVASLDGEISSASASLEEKSAGLAAVDALKRQWDELEAERAERTIQCGKLAALANDLTGNNPAKVSFDAWILGMYLEEITAYANERLERMSEGRYRIRLNDSYRKGNSQAGLDLEILDAYTGKARPSGTLSGGESFMASISLALGLADSIQARAGGIQLDAVFIDEGFGSLDESSLERAISILDEIRGSRMVGLVSHVAELRTRIPNRIEVVKTGGGSTIKKELCND